MAKQEPLAPGDVEGLFQRLFDALLPTDRPDPFGGLEEGILAVRESLVQVLEETDGTQEKIDAVVEQQKTEKTQTDLYRVGANDSRSSIESRTFGILFLQIFRVIKLFFGILPQGRVIILVIAALGLLQTFFDDGEVSLDTIKNAAKSTGLLGFIDKIMEELTREVGEIAQTAQDTGNAVSSIFVQMAGDLEETELDITLLRGFIDGLGLDPNQEDAQRVLWDVKDGLEGLVGDGGKITLAATTASNADLFLTPIMRGIDDEIRKIPDLAGKLVKLTT